MPVNSGVERRRVAFRQGRHGGAMLEGPPPARISQTLTMNRRHVSAGAAGVANRERVISGHAWLAEGGSSSIKSFILWRIAGPQFSAAPAPDGQSHLLSGDDVSVSRPTLKAHP
jgi:hypothetical protein